MFKGRERVAAFVTRWSTTPHLRDQSVAEHSFYVALYTRHICKMKNLTFHRTAEALNWALIHDMPELVTGDMPGPVKRVVTQKDILQTVEDDVFKELGPTYKRETDLIILDIVKAANLIDELFYLQNEKNLGNKYVDHVMRNTKTRFGRVLGRLNLLHLEDIIYSELVQMSGGIVSLKTEEDPHA